SFSRRAVSGRCLPARRRWETTQKLVERVRVIGWASRGGLAASVAILLFALQVACSPEAPSPATTGPAPTAPAPPFSGTNPNLAPGPLEPLVSRVALSPDDLLALVFPASTQPLQVVEAQRFLEQRTANPSVPPARTWDPSVIALLNYPEALALM